MTRCTICLLLLTAFALRLPAATITIDDGTVVAPASSFGVGINGGTSWHQPLSANLVDNPCFEAPVDGNGISASGWGWQVTSSPSGFTASVDTGTFTSGMQSQKIVVTAPPFSMQQGHYSIFQSPLSMQLIAGQTYIIKAQLKASTAGATVNLGWQGGTGYVASPPIAISTSWAPYSWSYTPSISTPMVAVTLTLNTATTYWIDDLIAWTPNEMDPVSGLDATLVARLQEMKPKMLRWGGLGINGIPLSSAILHPWPISYGPPAIQDDMDLGTFLTLCGEIGASAFITVPPAFTNTSDLGITDLTMNIVNNDYQDHGNLIDYIGGDASTPYGLIRQNQGFSRFDQQVPKIYYELGNEVWGTPDGDWDMNIPPATDLLTMMNTYATYCIKRMTEMKGRPGWRSNMKVGFGGRDPSIWIGQWPGSYDYTLVPQLAGLTDFSTIGLYYGQGTTLNTDEYVYGGLFAQSQIFAGEIRTLKTAFQTAAGHPIETCMYEGQSKWAPGYTPYTNPANPSDSSTDTMFPKETSLGSGVSLLDMLCGANSSGLTFANVFDFRSDCWGVITPYPARNRRPDFYALKMYDTCVSGNLVSSAISGNTTWNDAATGQSAVPNLACYPYLDAAGNHAIVLINRSRTAAMSVTINHTMAPTQLILLTSADINQQNESTEVAVPQTTVLPGTLVTSYTTTLPPFSAAILVATVPTTATPVIAPNGGTFATTASVTITCATAGSVIHYTTDGSPASGSSPVYASTLALSATTTVQAIATAAGLAQSAPASAVFTRQSVASTPVIAPNGGSFSSATAVTLTSASIGSVIRYTLDGTMPTASSAAYSAPLMVAATTTITAYASASGMTNSPLASATVTITAAVTSAGGGSTGTSGTTSAASGGGGGCGLGAGMAFALGLGMCLRRQRSRQGG